MIRWKRGQGHARGVRRIPGQMNGLERRYEEQVLKPRSLAGEIRWYRFDCIKLELARRTSYTPDFWVMLADDTLEIHEVKGHWEDDARVKIKVAAEQYPFRFIAVTQSRGQWVYENF